MKSRTLVTIGAVLLMIGAGSMFLPLSERARPPLETPRTIQATPRFANGDGSKSSIPLKADAEPSNGAKLPDEEKTAILNAIEQASVTYDSKALPLIEPYLLHPDPEVRLAAMNGMIVLGEAAAGPLLRKAAGKIESPKEAAALVESAEFVELPAGTFVPKDRTSAGNRTRLEGKPVKRSRAVLDPPAEPKDASSPPVE